MATLCMCACAALQAKETLPNIIRVPQRVHCTVDHRFPSCRRLIDFFEGQHGVEVRQAW